MKKLLLVLFALFAFSMASRAQWYLGGGLGFGKGPQDQFSIYIAPEVGYHLTNNFTLGGRVSYWSGYNQFGVDPYARWNFFKPDSFVRILATVHAPFKFSSSYTSYGFYLQPGISFRLGGSVRLECNFGAFGWGSYTSGGETSTGWLASVNSNNTSIGVVIAL